MFTKLWIKWGILGGVLSILYTYLTVLLGVYGNKVIGFFNLVILIVIIILCTREYYKKKPNSIYGIGIGLGALVGLLTTLLYCAWYYLLLAYFKPGLVFDSLNTPALRQEFKAEGLSGEEITKAIELMAVWISPGKQVIVILVVNLAVSIFIAIVATIIVRKSNKKLNPVIASS